MKRSSRVRRRVLSERLPCRHRCIARSRSPRVGGYRRDVVDKGSGGSKNGDKISITITSPVGAIVYSTGGLQSLKGGNITIH
jgi:hypothetical protein